jgi:hypothetical protein
MWDVAGLLPLITCDGLPYGRRLWVDSAFQTEDKVADRITNGAISVDLNAVGITVNNGGTVGQRLWNDGQIGCSLFNNAASAAIVNYGGVVGQQFARQDIALTAGGTTITRAAGAGHDSLSLISCERVPPPESLSLRGRYVTAHTPSIDNSSVVAGGLWLVQSTGFPGYTNQPIVGLRNGGSEFPQSISWACTADVYRNGEFVGSTTALRGPVSVEFVDYEEQVDSRYWTILLDGESVPRSFPQLGSQADAQAWINGRRVRTTCVGFFPNRVCTDEVFFVAPIAATPFYVNIGRDIYRYRTPVAGIVSGRTGYLQSPIPNELAGNPANIFPPVGTYTGPFFVAANSIIEVRIPFADKDLDPEDLFRVDRCDGLMNTAEWSTLTHEEGSYLVVSKCDNSCDPAGLLDPASHVAMGTHQPLALQPPVPIAFMSSPKNVAQQTTIFSSFVIDKTPPPLFWNVFDDMTVAESAQKGPVDWEILWSVRSDEPIGPLVSEFSDGGVEPTRWTAKTYQWLGANPGQKQTTSFNTATYLQPLEPGEYSITVTEPVKDRAGNAALEQPAVTFKVVEGTEDERRGRPRFEIPFESNALVNGQIFGGREYPVTQIDVVFADHVYGVTKRHFELKGFGRYLDKSVEPPALANGEIPQLMYEFPPQPPDGDTELERINPRGITKVERLSSKRLRLTLDSAMQFPGSKWRLFFTPDKQAFWADALPIGFDLEYRQTPAFISDSGGPVGETQLWQVKFPGGIDWPLFYDVDEEKWQIPFGDATYDAGDQIESEDQLAADLTGVGIWIKFKKPVQMACRTNWIVVRPPGTTPERIDVSGSIIGIGGVSSVTTEIDEPDSEGEPWRSQISASGSMWLSKTPGTFLHGSPESVDPFVPSVPPIPEEGDPPLTEPYSYWGLDTTIYPSPPKRLRPCKAPKSHQPHGSVFAGGTEFGINAALSFAVVPGSDGPPESLPSGKVYGTNVSIDFGIWRWSLSIAPQMFGVNAFTIGAARNLFNNLTFQPSGAPNRWSSDHNQTAVIGNAYTAIRSVGNMVSSVYVPIYRLGDISGVMPSSFAGPDDKDFPLTDGSVFTLGHLSQVTVGSGGWSLRALRTCTSYAGIGTSTPNEIVLEITGNVGVPNYCYAAPFTYNNTLKAWNPTTLCIAGFNLTYNARIVLSGQQEAAFMGGQSVSVAADVFSENYTPDDKGTARYVGRHVWTISKA